ncbi:L-seryl-tRNA(Sec) selenium transferase [Tuwongella immobilis]|uniref:L-seryl-tRNA(Sec) selenium transferase n=1 Tax=Tuwongella immobilis TaxID=692036 RepID=A0A6C2YRU4_9BACT|nr:L-seryl-tRNA(Sec) selenium transferase [Tuwongella immobilis]VIP03602.1 selenocysteine synthase : L-seryl-tRNA(Sec) selenium transferase OS=Desulfovibrio gigas DSM 1382 = ATCC 19364 GN=selA PE=3 SV=1: SelA [Tuwongella immobilis]VTS04572.1 selenocysteine synthase : L-seryl-tRNA(Sec) selenium transferase OS=Desulfovibrio gigas DSM 1382 = ATCC 19364 GN=selA PE=3 SV=1: SelA [Tuwongella immobilis]
MKPRPRHPLPPVNALLARVESIPISHGVKLAIIREVLGQARAQLQSGEADASVPSFDGILNDVQRQLHQLSQPHYRRVINATGIVLHTNLGRSLLSEPAIQAMESAARGYVNLEIDLSSGERSSRQRPIGELLAMLSGAEAATVVNNAAAATMLTLKVVAAGREVILSRGQLIEIGGSFRMPDIMAASGAILREVGTTNITRIGDYAKAICDQTAALMIVHPSNYRIEGFTETATLQELVQLGREKQLPVIDDIGSGAMLPIPGVMRPNDPVIPERIILGADLLICSGDKLLGGPQAGLIIGKKTWIDKIEADPWMRAFRLDKITLAALEATLRSYLNPEQAYHEIPTLAMLHRTEDSLRADAEWIASQLQLPETVATIRVIPSAGYVGGGSSPEQPLPSYVVAIRPLRMRETVLARNLRQSHPALLVRIQAGEILIDPRTILSDQLSVVVSILQTVLRE